MHPIVHKGRLLEDPPPHRVRPVCALLRAAADPRRRLSRRSCSTCDARRFHVFGTTFHPTDNLLLAALGFGVIVTVFFIGSTFGRIWCGFACPQTVYLEFLFRPIEAWLEGGPVNQKRLNAGAVERAQVRDQGVEVVASAPSSRC